MNCAGGYAPKTGYTPQSSIKLTSTCTNVNILKFRNELDKSLLKLGFSKNQIYFETVSKSYFYIYNFPEKYNHGNFWKKYENNRILGTELNKENCRITFSDIGQCDLPHTIGSSNCRKEYGEIAQKALSEVMSLYREIFKSEVSFEKTYR